MRCLCSHLVQLNMSSALVCVESGITLLSLNTRNFVLKLTVGDFTSQKGVCMFFSLWFFTSLFDCIQLLQ